MNDSNSEQSPPLPRRLLILLGINGLCCLQVLFSSLNMIPRSGVNLTSGIFFISYLVGLSASVHSMTAIASSNGKARITIWLAFLSSFLPTLIAYLGIRSGWKDAMVPAVALGGLFYVFAAWTVLLLGVAGLIEALWWLYPRIFPPPRRPLLIYVFFFGIATFGPRVYFSIDRVLSSLFLAVSVLGLIWERRRDHECRTS